MGLEVDIDLDLGPDLDLAKGKLNGDAGWYTPLPKTLGQTSFSLGIHMQRRLEVGLSLNFSCRVEKLVTRPGVSKGTL